MIKSSTIDEVRESVENIGGILDDVWRYTTLPFKQDRMVHVFDIIGMFVLCSKIYWIVTNLDCSKKEQKLFWHVRFFVRRFVHGLTWWVLVLESYKFCSTCSLLLVVLAGSTGSSLNIINSEDIIEK